MTPFLFFRFGRLLQILQALDQQSGVFEIPVQ